MTSASSPAEQSLRVTNTQFLEGQEKSAKPKKQRAAADDEHREGKYPTRRVNYMTWTAHFAQDKDGWPHVNELKKALTQGRWLWRFGCETGAEGRRHYQGYVTCAERVAMSTFAKAIERVTKTHVWCKKSNGNPSSNGAYTAKDGAYHTNMSAAHIAQLDREFKEDNEVDPPLSPIHGLPKLRAGQEQWFKIIGVARAKTERIYWLADTEGGWGKTILARWHARTTADVCRVIGGKPSDISFALHQWMTRGVKKGKVVRRPHTLIISLPRCGTRGLDYGFLESISDGDLQNTKYESTLAVQMNPVRIVVYANEEPTYSALSARKWAAYKTVFDGMVEPIKLT